MRTEQQMLSLILDIARRDERVRAVYMNGSRANPGAPRDALQDFDVVYVVTQTRPFVEDKTWLSAFGELAILQEPDRSTLFDDHRNPDESYGYLMQFADGNRIDMTVQTREVTAANYLSDSQTVPLLDKDGLLPAIPPPSDADYLIRRPTAEQYRDCCNEFWWITLYVAKGLYRGELLYALEHLNAYLRPMLLMMLSWQAGLATDFTCSAGKCCKYLPGLLPQEDAAALLRTWPTAGRPAIEAALAESVALFRRSAAAVAQRMGFAYDQREEDGATACLAWMLALEHPGAVERGTGGTQPIDTPRLILRPFRPEDAAGAWKNWAGDPQVQHEYGELACADEAQVAALIRGWAARYAQDNFYRWAVTLRDSGECIGQIAFYQVNERHRMADVEYCVGRPWQGQGYATEALSAVVEYAFGHTGLHRLQAFHRGRNAASGRVLAKAGFRREGVLRQSFYYPETNRYDDRVYYGVTRLDGQPLTM